MRGTRHSEEQIIGILKASGERPADGPSSAGNMGISEQTLYRWKAKYGGLDSGG